MDDLLQDFLTETLDHIETVDRQLVEFERTPSNGEILRNIFRLVHTIKGTCGFIGLPRLEALAHAAENLLGQLRDGAEPTPAAVDLTLASIDRLKAILTAISRTGAEPEGSDADLIAALNEAAARLAGQAPPAIAGEGSDAGTIDAASPPEPEAGGLPAAGRQSLRVNLATLEHLMNMVSELVLSRNQLVEIARHQEAGPFKAPLQRLSHITAELQDGVMKTRMQPIGAAWGKLPRLVRDLAAGLGKKVTLQFEGDETELDRQIIDRIGDPLTHMVRNALDHGIEAPEERRRGGKPEAGLIRVGARHEGGSITLRISDDGRGLDLARIRAKAIEAGLATATQIEAMPDAQVARFVFAPGLTTAAAVTSLSGRGVGMDVVKTNIDALGGQIDIETAPGRGTTVTVRIPLTLAIVPALIVQAGGQRYAIPQTLLRELIRVGPGRDHSVEAINGAWVLRSRGRTVPVVGLAQALGLHASQAPEQGPEGFVVMTQADSAPYGLLVDAVTHTEEIVVKPMCAPLRGLPAYSGNTILGDGSVVLILDPGGIGRAVAGLDGPVAAAAPACDEARPEAAELPQAMLVFRAAPDTLRALPLSLVARLEDIDVNEIEAASGRWLVQYRGQLMPIVPAMPGMPLRDEGTQPLIVVSDGGRSMGLAVESIVDIVAANPAIDVAAAEPGILGSAVIGGRATDVVDLSHYLTLAHPDWLTGRKGPGPQDGAASLLLIEPSAFIREMLLPVLRTGGRQAEGVASLDAARFRSGRRAPDVVLIDLDAGADPAPGDGGLRKLLGLGPSARLVGLATLPRADILASAREAGIAEVVAKFDRPGLLRSLGLASRGLASQEAA